MSIDFLSTVVRSTIDLDATCVTIVDVQDPDPWLAPAADAWIELSARLQRVVTARSGRSDVVVRIAPRAVDDGPAWSGCYRHDLAEVRLDARRVLDRRRDDPRCIDLSHGADRDAHPLLVGAVCLAAAHAAHTTWDLPVDADPRLLRAIHLIERLRVAAGRLRVHKADRRWLRAAARMLAPDDAIWAAPGVIGLSLADVLTGREAEPTRAGLAATMGENGVRDIERVLRDAIALADDRRDELIRCAEELVTVLGLAGPPAEGPPTAAATGDGDAGRDTPGHGPGAVLGQVADAAREPSRLVGVGVSPARLRRDIDDAERQNARAASRATFETPRSAAHAVHRTPHPVLCGQARALADALRRARYRAPAVTAVPSATPPGVLRLSEAMRREAQRSAGAEVTARPWLRARRREVEQPPLRVGLSWDISRSRSSMHARMADLAWALAWAMAHIEGELAAVAWNSAAYPVAWPGRVPDAVVEPVCRGGSSACPQSLRALDGALGLRQATGVRLVIVATDGRLTNRRLVQDEVHSLVRSGVIVLWVTPEPDPRRPPAVPNIVLSEPDNLVPTLGSAVCRALAPASG